MTVRRYKDSYGEFNADIDCVCRQCLLRIATWDEENEVSFSFWYPAGTGSRSFWNRLRAAWKMLKSGHGYEEVIICREAALELAKVLAEGIRLEEKQDTQSSCGDECCGVCDTPEPESD